MTIDMETEIDKIDEAFKENELWMGRMISGSKTGYIKFKPKGEPVFNSNIIIEGYGKVWFGDIDLNYDNDKLQRVANTVGKTLYVLRERDARFGTEDDPFEELAKRAVGKIEPKK